MAGTLVIDTLKASSGALATQNGMTGICKAWVYFNGSTASIRGSFNVSSISKTGTGDYTVNFTTALPDANYAVAGMGSNETNAQVMVKYSPTATPTSSVRVGTQLPGTANGDSTMASVAIFSA